MTNRYKTAIRFEKKLLTTANTFEILSKEYLLFYYYFLKQSDEHKAAISTKSLKDI